ncbi:MAG: type II toxin-antitoxin system RelE/ParE family toxin [Stellaceae bacterium]
MLRVIWTPRALRDMARLHGFLARTNRVAARRATGAIREAVQALTRHPQIGRPMRDMPPEFREWFIPFGGAGYLALYRYDGELVAIVAVRHAREAGY